MSATIFPVSCGAVDAGLIDAVGEVPRGALAPVGGNMEDAWWPLHPLIKITRKQAYAKKILRFVLHNPM
jgi:hypothetical protein